MEKLEEHPYPLLPASMQHMHNKYIEWKSLAEFWKVELHFFDRLIRMKDLVTDSEYSDRILETLQAEHVKLEREVASLFPQLARLEHNIAQYGKSKTASFEDMSSQRYDKTKRLVRKVANSIKAYKERLYEFAERWY